MKTDELYYSDKEVKAFLHNLAIAVTRWDRMRGGPTTAIQNLAGGLVVELRDVFSHDDMGREIEQLISDEALAFALIVAAHILLTTSPLNEVTEEEMEAETKMLSRKKLIRSK